MFWLKPKWVLWKSLSVQHLWSRNGLSIELSQTRSFGWTVPLRESRESSTFTPLRLLPKSYFHRPAVNRVFLVQQGWTPLSLSHWLLFDVGPFPPTTTPSYSFSDRFISIMQAVSRACWHCRWWWLWRRGCVTIYSLSLTSQRTEEGAHL